MSQKLAPDVESAVNDILHGTARDSHTEWLQREYIRLMRREFNTRRQSDYERKRVRGETPGTAPSDGLRRNHGGGCLAHRKDAQHIEHQPDAHADPMHADTE